MQSIAAIGSDVYVAALGYGVYKSTDNGSSWALMNTGLPDVKTHFITSSGKTLYVGIRNEAQPSPGGGLFVMTEGASVWKDLHLSPYCIHIVAIRGTDLWAGGHNQIFVSTDGGNTWSFGSSPSAGSVSGTVGGVWGIAFSGTRTFVGMQAAGVTFTDDLHASDGSWKRTSLSGVDISALAVVNGKLYAGGPGVMVSSDAGTTWTPFNNGITISTINAFGVKGTDLYAAGWDSCVFQLKANTTTWKSISDGLMSQRMFAVGFNDNYAFASAGVGVFRRPLQ